MQTTACHGMMTWMAHGFRIGDLVDVKWHSGTPGRSLYVVVGPDARAWCSTHGRGNRYPWTDDDCVAVGCCRATAGDIAIVSARMTTLVQRADDG